MYKHKDLYESAQHKDDSGMLCCAVASMLDTLERTNPKMYHEFVEKLENIAYNIPYVDAERIVMNMNPKGQHWGYNEVEQLCNSKGITEGITDYYIVMNMMYNDYYNTAHKYGLKNDVEFYWSLSYDFITDADAPAHKVAKYFSM